MIFIIYLLLRMSMCAAASMIRMLATSSCKLVIIRTKCCDLVNMKIAVIGAGAAGLASLKHSLDEGHQCVVFEQTGNVGGTWNYTEEVGVNEYGLPVHSSMYSGLRTNIPKELMQYEGFPYTEPDVSYITQPDVLKYINSYANSFNLLPHIKFFKYVLEVNPSGQSKWTVKVKDVKTKIIESNEYDTVFVCVGNYSVPRIPKVQGLETFKGKTIHSHAFRKPDAFTNKKVLVVGAGSSGSDICRLVAEVATKVFISIRPGKVPFAKLPETVSVKPEIEEFQENRVKFVDNSVENIDEVIFCTGYIYSYPFLSSKCGIEVENNWVKYLYKQIVNVEHPTMGFIGVPFRITPFPAYGIQVRFFLAFLNGKVKITKDQMMQELNEYRQKQKDEGIPQHHAHLLGLKQGWYFDDLADTANIKKVPPVIYKLYSYVTQHTKGQYHLSYKLLNDNEFLQVP